MKYSKEQIECAVNNSNSKTDCLTKLNLHPHSTYSYKILNYHLRLFNIDTNHFHKHVTTKPNNNKIPLQEILDGKHPLYKSHNLRLRLIKENIFEHKCYICNNETWMGMPIPLDLDHINGDPSDHRLENLRLLCRNCHAQTDTFCGKNNTKIKIIKINDKKNKQLERINLIKLSNIDFTKRGWVNQVSRLINIQHQKVGPWMKQWMPLEYSTANKRKSPIKGL